MASRIRILMSLKALERIPGRAVGDLQVAEICAQPDADAGTHRHQHHAAVLHHVEAEAGMAISIRASAEDIVFVAR